MSQLKCRIPDKSAYLILNDLNEFYDERISFLKVVFFLIQNISASTIIF